VTHRLLLLRHGEVPSHRGDVAVTDRGLDGAEQVGRRLATIAGRIRVLTGETLRTRQTGAAIATGASAAALAEQVPGMTFDEAAAVPFFVEFFDHPDRIGWWLRLGDAPGDDAEAVARRIGHFAASLPDRTTQPTELTVGVTHSPVLRACALAHLGHDPGEPEWLSGLELSVSSDRSVRARHPWIRRRPR
jgi:broad specificity phosphatase PhoE